VLGAGLRRSTPSTEGETPETGPSPIGTQQAATHARVRDPSQDYVSWSRRQNGSPDADLHRVWGESTRRPSDTPADLQKRGSGSAPRSPLDPALQPGDHSWRYPGGRARVAHPAGDQHRQTTVRIHLILRRALGDALRWGLRVAKLAECADPPRSRSAEAEVSSPNQVRRFLEYHAGDLLAGGWRLATATVLRRSGWLVCGGMMSIRWSRR
jgi:hypothetical protein